MCPKMQQLRVSCQGAAQATKIGSKIYVFAGEDAARRPTADLFVLDMADSSWSRGEASGQGPPARSAHTACSLAGRCAHALALPVLLHHACLARGCGCQTEPCSLRWHEACESGPVRASGSGVQRSGSLNACMLLQWSHQEGDLLAQTDKCVACNHDTTMLLLLSQVVSQQRHRSLAFAPPVKQVPLTRR